jgi:predicted nucleotidyltransferase component of viral defense system
MAELTPLQKKVLELFSQSHLRYKFYWTGGTLLSSVYLYHRQSKDIDFFSGKPFGYNEIISFVQNLKKQLKLKEIEEKKIFDRWEFFLHNEEELRIEFVFYGHPRIKPLKKWQGILIDSLEDIAANKVMAFFDRNDPKDLVDLYFLLIRKRFRVKQLLKWAERKFGVKIEESSFWSESHKALKDLNEISPLLSVENRQRRREIIDKIKDYFSSRSADYLRKMLK